MKKTLIATAMMLSLAACGGGSSASEQSTSTKPSILTSSPVSFGTIDPKIKTEYSGAEEFHYDTNIVDANGDGYDDLVITPMLLESTAKPMLYLFDPATKQFVFNTQFQTIAPKMQHPRHVVMIDVNGDSRKDMLFVNHGYDDSAWGEQNNLLLNTPSGFVDATNTMPQVRDYSHGFVKADFFLDGYDDIIFLNSYNVSTQSKCTAHPEITTLECTNNPAEGNSYVLSNNGSGTLTKTTLNAGLNFSPDGEPRLSMGGSADFNNDGIPDIVATYGEHGDTAKIKIMESTSLGNYTTTKEFAGTYFNGQNCQFGTAYANINITDLNGNGRKEILTYEVCSWDNMYMHVFEKDSSGIWQDITSTLIPDQTANFINNKKTWCMASYVLDINGDDVDDVVCASRAGTYNAFWVSENGVLANKQYSANNLISSDPYSYYAVLNLGSERYVVNIKATSMGVNLNGWRAN